MRVMIIIFSTVIWINSFAQIGNKIVDEKIKVVGKDMCNCFMPAVDTLHPIIKEMVENLVLLGEDSAAIRMRKWYKKNSEDEVSKVMRQANEFLQGNSISSHIDKCVIQIGTKYENDPVLDNLDDEIFIRKTLEYLQSDNKCKLLAYLYILGTKDD